MKVKNVGFIKKKFPEKKLLYKHKKIVYKGLFQKKIPNRVGTPLIFFYLGGGRKMYFFSGGCCQISI
jgi:hypothetical protein